MVWSPGIVRSCFFTWIARPANACAVAPPARRRLSNHKEVRMGARRKSHPNDAETALAAGSTDRTARDGSLHRPAIGAAVF